jgi:hypothetical protein
MSSKYMSYEECHDAIKSVLLRTYPKLPDDIKIANWGIIVCPGQNKIWVMTDGDAAMFLLEWVDGVFSDSAKEHRN